MHIDHVHQMEDTPKELLKLNEHSDITKDKFTDTSVTDDDFQCLHQRDH